MNIRIALFIVLLTIGLFAQSQGVDERKQNFNSDWKFKLSDSIEASQKWFNDASWSALDLPHDWSIEGNFDQENPAGNDGAYLPTGIGWYRKTFRAPQEWEDKKITIYFEGVYMNSEVFINGESLGIYPYGYSSFFYDLTPHLKIGEENTLAVRVDNSQQKNSRWYSGSGIYRNVWLLITNPTHIDYWGVYITTPKVSTKFTSVHVKTLIKNETNVPKNTIIRTEILGQTNKILSIKETPVVLKPNFEGEIIQELRIKRPILWSPDTPFLYAANSILKEDTKEIDRTTTYFGIRSIAFSSEKGFLLNGKEVVLNGGCVHHDNGCLGAAAFDRAEERKAALLKQAGFNAVRTAHNIPSEAFLNACDRLGLLVIDEAFDGWREMKTSFTPLKYDYASLFDEWWQRDLHSMVLRDRNHPSIIMWSVGNEIIERTKPEAVETATMLVKEVHRLDATRPVTSAMTTWGEGWDIFDPLMEAHDVCGYNYQLHEAIADHERVPSRIIVQTESYPVDAFTNWNLVTNHKYIIGDFVWTAIDYLGESGIGRWYYTGDVPGEHWERNLFPWHAAYCGDVDLTGWRKPISHYRSMLYNNDERIYMAVREPEPLPLKIHTTRWGVWPTWESWTWPGYEGKELEVEVYSTYDKVKLYLNDSLLEEKQTNKESEFKALFKVPYSSGTLKAIGVSGDKEMETTLLRTSESVSKISLLADRETLKADGQDLTFVSVQLTDSNGILNPTASHRLNFEISGPGAIAGIANGDVKDTEAYSSASRKAFHGRVLVVIKSKNQPGIITLTVRSEELASSEISIKTIN